MEIYLHRFKVEQEEGWLEWLDKIPEISFKPHWHVQVIPPFSGAMARFRVRSGYRTASVYLDCHNVLGYEKGPYWEVYPVDDDIGRASMNDVTALLNLIERSLGESE